jgi:hypothetical protein
VDEKSIKAAVLTLVRSASRGCARPIVASEFKISMGNTRADLAILSDEFVGVEIKSKRDSLSRLLKQAQDYRAYFDRTVLVLDSRHLLRYLKYSFDFCDVWTFDELGELRQFSHGTHRRAEDANLIALLTQAERKMMFRDPKFSNLSKRESFEAIFSLRYRQTSSQFWQSVKRRKITRLDIDLLSRYQDARVAWQDLYERRQREVLEWMQAHDDQDQSSQSSSVSSESSGSSK